MGLGSGGFRVLLAIRTAEVEKEVMAPLAIHSAAVDDVTVGH
jgi:hypothetical protein